MIYIKYIHINLVVKIISILYIQYYFNICVEIYEIFEISVFYKSRTYRTVNNLQTVVMSLSEVIWEGGTRCTFAPLFFF